MKKLLTFLIVGASLAGCATVTPDPWAGLEKPEPTAETPLPLPALSSVAVDPVARTVTVDVDELDALITVAEANTAIASELSGALVEQKKATGALIDAGRAQRQQAVILKEMLDDERKRRVWDNIVNWTLIIVLGAAAL